MPAAARGTTATGPTAGEVLTADELEAMAEVLPLLARTTRTTSPRARCPASTPRARSSRAARATTSSAATPRSRTSTRRWSTAWRASTRRRPRPCPAPIIQHADRRHVRRHLAGRLRPGRARGAWPCWPSAGVVGRLHARARLPVRRGGRDVPGRRTTRSFVVEQNRDAQLRTLLTLRDRGRQGQAAVACWSTAASRCRPATWSTASWADLQPELPAAERR